MIPRNRIIRFFAAVGLGVMASGAAMAQTDCTTASIATGGTVSQITVGNQIFCVHSFSTVGTSTFTLNQNRGVEYLIVGGGGGAGTGGGGAGGMLEGTVAGMADRYTVTVGAGGAQTPGLNQRGFSGGNSSVFGFTAIGGGGGGRNNRDDETTRNGLPGGSGGGAGRNTSGTGTGGAGQPGQGFAGADMVAADNAGGGGGGAGGAATGINGGGGRASAITGTTITYAGGGASADNTTNGTNGAGQDQPGGGGQHRSQPSNTFTEGRAGIVILRYVVNARPTANAGPDANAFAGLEFTLTGTGSTDPDDNITAYQWVQTGGTTQNLTGNNTAEARFTPGQPASGTSETLTFELTVTDAFGLTSTDTVVITLQGMADLTATKTARVFSEDGSGCADFGATPPAIPANPAAIPGACIEYTITVVNTGPVPATAIDLTDILPSQLALVAATRAGWDETGAGFAFVANAPTVAVENGIIGTGANNTATITIRATLR